MITIQNIAGMRSNAKKAIGDVMQEYTSPSIPGWKKSYTRDVPEFTKDEAALKVDTREKMGQILHGAYQN
jgi:hypothetical protein